MDRDLKNCEVKISPAILINKKINIKQDVTAISGFWPPNVNEGSPHCNPLDSATPELIAEELGECKQQVKQDWPQIAEVHMKEMNSVSPEACIFPYKEC